MQPASQNTLRPKDCTITINLQETIQHMQQVLTPEDNQEDDTELEKNVRAPAQEDIDTDDNKKFTVHGVKKVVLSMGKIKSTG